MDLNKMGEASRCYNGAEQVNLISSILQLHCLRGWFSAAAQKLCGMGAVTELPD